MPHRFQDTGQNVWSFAGDILVRCPSCGGRACVSQRDEGGRSHSRLTCSTCGLAQASPMSTSPWRCRHCGHWFNSTVWTSFGRGMRTVNPCPKCHEYRDSTIRWQDLGKPVDPFFGLALYVQAPCCGNVLWAWNLQHLDLLAAVVGARLRERARGLSFRSNDTLLAKLPRWVKAAKSREPVLECVAKLRATASGPVPKPRTRKKA